MKTIARFSLIFLLFLVAACVPFTQKSIESVVSTSTLTSVEPSTPTAVEGITEQQLKNMEYLSPNFGKTVKLVDGVYYEGETSVTLFPQIAIGDLNGDQIDDAAVLLAESGGGTGTFVSLVIIASQNGHFTQVGSAPVDDRPVIETLTIENGALRLNAIIHAINDPMVSPTLKVSQTYKLLENYLVMVNQSSTPQGGTERSIAIDAPLDGSAVTENVPIKGSMPIAPFENSLRFRILDLTGKELLNSGFMVTSTDVGAPAAFDNEITMPTLPSGAWVRLELAELSMADGSVMDMNSVLVKIK
jgi:hypothetical protein